jgi:type I restriction enzyme, S subunit
VIYSCVRPYLLNVAVIETDFDPAPIASTAFAILNGHGLVLPRYLWIVLRSPFMVECVEENQRGQAYPAINDADFAVLSFPLPPLAEQHRIVAKVDELMALCDRLEAARAAREATRDRLTAASLARLNAPDPETFQDDARFALDSLPALTTRLDQIKQFRQTILNLAVRGKLVAQDLNDETISKLLKRIAAEKARLVTAGDIRNDGEFSAIGNDLLQLPSTWAMVPLRTLLLSSFYGPRFGVDEYSKTGIPTIRTTDMTGDGRIILRDPPRVHVPADRLHDFQCKKGDLLVTRTGSIGTMAVFEGDYPAIPSAYLIRLRFSSHMSVSYIHLVLRSPYGQAEMGLGTTRLAQPNINARSLAAISMPLPPLAEQRRIVAKVDELMALCDRLEATLTTTDDTRRRLLEVLLAEALAPDDERELEAAE